MRNLRALIGFLAASFAVSLLGGLATARSVGTWYQTLAKPPFNPPDWVFAPVWTILYIMIAVSGWMVWCKIGFADRLAFTAYGLQLALNLLWSLLFFGLRQPALALIEIAGLWVMIAATLVMFWKHDRIAALLLAPYLAWVSFATALNTALVVLN